MSISTLIKYNKIFTEIKFDTSHKHWIDLRKHDVNTMKLGGNSEKVIPCFTGDNQGINIPAPAPPPQKKKLAAEEYHYH